MKDTGGSSYVGNNPWSNTDPMGKRPSDPVKGIKVSSVNSQSMCANGSPGDSFLDDVNTSFADLGGSGAPACASSVTTSRSNEKNGLDDHEPKPKPGGKEGERGEEIL